MRSHIEGNLIPDYSELRSARYTRCGIHLELPFLEGVHSLLKITLLLPPGKLR